MNNFYPIITSTILSQLILVIILLVKGKNTPLFFPFLFYAISKLIFSISTIGSAFIINSSYPVFHLTLFAEFLLILFLFDKILRIKSFSIPIMILGLICFVYESIILNNWFENNEIFTVYFNLSIGILSLKYLFEFINSKFNPNKKLLSFLFGFLFVKCASSLILSLFESDIRFEPNALAVLLLYFYNAFEILQGLLVSRIIWKLKEA